MLFARHPLADAEAESWSKCKVVVSFEGPGWTPLLTDGGDVGRSASGGGTPPLLKPRGFCSRGGWSGPVQRMGDAVLASFHLIVPAMDASRHQVSPLGGRKVSGGV